MDSTGYQIVVGCRLRAARNALGLSLMDVQGKSRGKWNASVVGSYERGSRAITAARLCELAEFLAVTPSSLLPDDPPDGKVARLAEALVAAGLGSSEFAADLARRLAAAGVTAPRAKRGAA